MEDVVVRGVTLKEKLVTAVFVNVPNTPGAAAGIFAEIAEHDIIVDDIMQTIHGKGGQANIGFTAEAADLPEIKSIAAKLVPTWPEAHFEVSGAISKVSVIGIGMRSHSGVARKMFTTLADSGINIENISTSEIVISCMVQADQGQRALQLLHAAFELDRSSEGQ